VTASPWLRWYRRNPTARLRLVCFPHAGGNAAFYRPWLELLPAEVDLAGVHYPGRLDRLGEPSVEDMDTMVGHVGDTLAPGRPAAERPLVLFGHSMGAAVAHEVARHLEERGVSVAHLVVSGRQPPEHHRPGRLHLDSDDALWAELRRLGGTGDALLERAELRRLTTPAIRADYRLIETYRPRPAAPVRTPILALVGDADPDVSTAEAADWRGHTSGGFRLLVFAGHHFYLIAQRAAVVAEVLRHVAVRGKDAEEGSAAWRH
jgi:pyochelin biosynthetic protein PchC